MFIGTSPAYLLDRADRRIEVDDHLLESAAISGPAEGRIEMGDAFDGFVAPFAEHPDVRQVARVAREPRLKQDQHSGQLADDGPQRSKYARDR